MSVNNLQYPNSIDLEVENVVQIEVFDRKKYNAGDILLADIFMLSPAVINSSIASAYESKQLGGNKVLNKALNLFSNAVNSGLDSARGGNFSGSELTAFESGTMSSPNLRVLYTQTPLRNHSFTFEFSPESKEDSLILLNIYNLLREAALPEDDGVGNILFPYEVKITFWYKNEINKFIPKTKKSVITRITSNFQSENVLLFSDGSPITRIISFEILETISLRRNDIAAGF